jgi:hypothetical protein
MRRPARRLGIVRMSSNRATGKTWVRACLLLEQESLALTGSGGASR